MSHERILIATDDSEPAQRATEEAFALAKSFDATLYALYVLEAAEPPPWFEDPAAKPGIDTRARQALDGVVSKAAERNLGRDIVKGVIRGPTSVAILEYADEHDIDLIVIGTHGRTGIDRVLMGSIAEKVVRGARVPVVTVSE